MQFVLSLSDSSVSNSTCQQADPPVKTTWRTDRGSILNIHYRTSTDCLPTPRSSIAHLLDQREAIDHLTRSLVSILFSLSKNQLVYRQVDSSDYPGRRGETTCLYMLPRAITSSSQPLWMQRTHTCYRINGSLESE